MADADANLRRVATADLEKSAEPKPASLVLHVTQSKNGVVPHTWDSRDDPDNPQNWSYFRKVYGVAIPAWISLAVTLGTSVITPGIPEIVEKFHVSRTAALLSIGVYAIGLALGPILGAPVSETIGRRWVFLTSLPISLLFTMGAGLAQNFGTLLICRLLASTFGGPGIAIGAGSVVDLWHLNGGGPIASMLYILMPFLGSALGPLIGGFAVEKQRDWRWTMWVTIMVGGPAWIAAFFLKETYAKRILARRAVKRGLPQPPKPPAKQALKTMFLITMLRPVHMLVLEPIVSWMSLYVAFAFGILYGFFDAFPYIFSKVYNFSTAQVGLTYISIIVGEALAVLTYVIINKTQYARAKAKVAEPGKLPPPESRLFCAMMGSVALPISLFWLGWTARESIHWIVPVLAGVPFGWGLILVFTGITNYLVHAYQASNAASAVAASGILRYSFGGGFPLFTTQMYETLDIAWATSLLGFISIVLMPTPWVFFKFGPRLRKRSAYDMGHFQG